MGVFGVGRFGESGRILGEVERGIFVIYFYFFIWGLKFCIFIYIYFVVVIYNNYIMIY